MKCCMTGPAFEVLLQADAAVVHAVLASVAVFARMRGQQKGQVMDLLGRRGLHLTLDGEQRHISVSLVQSKDNIINYNNSIIQSD